MKAEADENFLSVISMEDVTGIPVGYVSPKTRLRTRHLALFLCQGWALGPIGLILLVLADRRRRRMKIYTGLQMSSERLRSYLSTHCNQRRGWQTYVGWVEKLGRVDPDIPWGTSQQDFLIANGTGQDVSGEYVIRSTWRWKIKTAWMTRQRQITNCGLDFNWSYV